MRNAAAEENLDIRLQSCKHDRLRAAMAAHSPYVVRPQVAQAAPVVAVAPSTTVARPARAPRGYLSGAVATTVLAFSWFLVASYSAMDLSVFESDANAWTVTTQATATAPAMPG
jgi:hypothetical protein